MRPGIQESMAGLGKRPESCLTHGSLPPLPSFFLPGCIPKALPLPVCVLRHTQQGGLSELSTTATTQLPRCEPCLQEEPPSQTPP